MESLKKDQVLIFLGLPPQVANGTNRIAIVVQDTINLHDIPLWRSISIKSLVASKKKLLIKLNHSIIKVCSSLKSIMLKSL